MPDAEEPDQLRAATYARARQRLSSTSDLPPMPWQAAGVPPDDVTLIRNVLWRANRGADADTVRAELESALQLMDSARAELDALETGLLFVARAEGLTWGEVARHRGLKSPQAAQQRQDRLSTRTALP
ncbi:MAG: hypothetical protein L0G99_02055 [Propionibacteriales bacterium]|nr:hypothetical protein [Propionibacteriales bacterium]